MVGLLHEAIDAGGHRLLHDACRSRTPTPTASRSPSRWASREEVLALCGAVRAHEGTTLEYVTDGCLRGFRPDEVELMAEMTLAARRPLNWNVLTIDSKEPERYREQLAANEHAAAAGGRSVALTMPVLVEMNMSFLTYCALFMLPDWSEVMNLPVPERMAKLRDPAVRAHLRERARVARGRRVRAAHRLGPLHARRHVLGGERRAEGPRASPTSRSERGQDEFDTLLDDRARRRPAHDPVAAPDRQRRRVLGASPAGMGARRRAARRLRRRRSPRSHVRRAVHDRGSSPTASAGGSSSRSSGRCS